MNIYERPTPRTDAVWDKTPNADLASELRYHACRLEQELDTVRDAHMANCLASDTLRREIHDLREQLSMNSDTE